MENAFMGRHTKIEWASSSWNPWMGCAKVSEGCRNCYAQRDMKRFGRDFGTPTRSKTTFEDPLKWKEPRRIFVCSWSDFFLETVPPDWREDAWAVMRQAPQHTYLLLTKRPQNIAGMLPKTWTARPYPNVWLGVSAENPRRADQRGDPVPVQVQTDKLNWVITGGESDLQNLRPMDLAWVRSIRDQCQEAGVAFFYKQRGGTREINGAWGGGGRE